MINDTEFTKIIFADDTDYHHYVLEELLKEKDGLYFQPYIE